MIKLRLWVFTSNTGTAVQQDTIFGEIRSQPTMADLQPTIPPASLLFPQVAICRTIASECESAQKELIECSHQQSSIKRTTLVVPRSTLAALTVNEITENPDSTKLTKRSKEETDATKTLIVSSQQQTSKTVMASSTSLTTIHQERSKLPNK